MKVCIGGTFNILHKGHKMLINQAFKVAGKNGNVFIGITRGEITKRKMGLKSYEQRKLSIKQYLYEQGFIKQTTIKPIVDKYGPSLDGDFDAIVVTPETIKIAEEINQKRITNGKKPLQIVKIPFILADDGFPISSTRILQNKIDENGKIKNRD